MEGIKGGRAVKDKGGANDIYAKQVPETISRRRGREAEERRKATKMQDEDQ